MKLKLGQKVFMSEHYSKWHLDHPEIYFFGNLKSLIFDSEVQLHMMRCIGQRVPGKVISLNGSEGCVKVRFKLAGLIAEYWVDSKDIDLK